LSRSLPQGDLRKMVVLFAVTTSSGACWRALPTAGISRGCSGRGACLCGGDQPPEP
jgi:hypothetical protein